ncbi:thiamine pyrophosphate-binding protein [Nostoc sp. UCD121]|uniref:ScyA-related TPP-binding enzyme n=1 Tax=unclassified Nostoc TaxID=2593658 RepID=UPI00162AADDC|nr:MULTISPECIES: ScyA-related TPP-binding enzyme [unclassified Nostoc]MBC1224044.1 thiamine pyrophosphate-binding protein [Nostoc sp. UCD120]MBC1276092.1 thiamine pyrophosphate-binding protein [Nostoc sp. UCD121]MBC1294645.1 thiamine pyrophosphate-binding protein [Nostoc sp. UCD122]
MHLKFQDTQANTTEQLNSTEQQSHGKPSRPSSVAEAVVKMLGDMGVEYAFGVSGGAIAPVWAALHQSSLQVLHFRHEAGAAFAAIEAYFVSDRPVVVFTTTGPGITNALTGLLAARWEGAKVILISASTSAPQRGRWACQETSAYTIPSAGIFTSGTIFHYATTLESSDELPEIARRLAIGLAQPEGFVAHISIPTNIQTSPVKTSLPQVTLCHAIATASEETIGECVRLLSEGAFAIWVGFGARGAAKEIRQLAERTGAAVMCSPRAKGIFPEDHPQFVGVTGFGGHESVFRYMREQRPTRILVLGTRLGEFTSLWNPEMIPRHGFLHVDIDTKVPGTAYPSAETFAIQSDVAIFLKNLLKNFPESTGRSRAIMLPRFKRDLIKPRVDGLVRPELLMNVIQQVIVDGSDALVMAESGNSFAWVIHLLRFTTSSRYRISNGFGSMGHFVTGVVGAALARNGKAVAIVGDGAMLMNSEVNTAVKYQVPAVWIILNDGRYNICEQGIAYLGFKNVDATIPQADFVKIAQGMGADGIRVEREAGVQIALEKAIAAKGPFVVDVIIDPTQIAPTQSRNLSLILQGATNY